MRKSFPIQLKRLVTAALDSGGEVKNNLPSFAQLKEEALSDTETIIGGESFRSPVIEKAGGNGTRQLLFNRLTRDKGQFLIEEAVVNFLSAQTSLPFARMIIRDCKSGRHLDPDRLLPPDCAFTPSRLLKVRVEFDRHHKRMKSEFFPVNLKTYRGAGSEGEFYFNREAGRLAYGNLTGRGALLSLFHEIAHAWQFADSGRSAKKDFSSLFSFLSLRLHNLGVRMEAYKNGAVSEERFHHFIDLAREKLAEKGIKLDTESIITENPQPPENSIIFTAHSGKRFFFHSQAFSNALKAYIQTERDAWAHAILALRMVRKRGFNLEPGFRKLKDFRNYIHPHLENYCASINSQLEMDIQRLRPKNKKNAGRNPRLTSQLS